MCYNTCIAIRKLIKDEKKNNLQQLESRHLAKEVSEVAN